MSNRGAFIVIDGMDGSGKGTQIALLKQKLADKNVLFTREPGGSPRAEEIREMLLSSSGSASNPVCDFFLFWAARGSHIEDVVGPALENGKHVISDRFDSSTHAFQIHGEQSDQWLSDLFHTIRTTLPEKYRPDLYIVLDLDPETALGRRSADTVQEKSKFDLKALEYHERVRTGFKHFEKTYGNVTFVDASRSPDEVHQDIWEIVSRQLNI